MGSALAVCHGAFGRASLYRLNKPLAPHAHREGHLIFLVDGEPGRVDIDGVSFAVDPLRAVAVRPWQPHGFQPTDYGRGAVFLTLYIDPRWYGQAVQAAGAAPAPAAPSVELNATVRTLVGRTVAALASGEVNGTIDNLLLDLTVAAFLASAPSGPAGVMDALRPGDFRIRNAIRLMNERVTDACVLDHIAREAGLSRPHFYKLFRENVGVTPNMYLNTLRLERSIGRLIRTDDPVTAIGLDLGFASQASFTRFFSNNIGISPTDYRRASLIAA